MGHAQAISTPRRFHAAGRGLVVSAGFPPRGQRTRCRASPPAIQGNARRLKTIESCVLGTDICIDDACGEDRAHLLHVRDAAHAAVLAATAPGPLNGVFNISGMPEDFLSFQEIVDILHAAFPHAGKVLFKGKNPPQKFGLYFHDKAGKAFGYAPAISARHGLVANAEQRLGKQSK